MREVSDVEQIAQELIRALASLEVRADRFTTGPGTAGVNVWGEGSRQPLASVVINQNERFSDIAWGHRHEHVVSLETAPADVAAAVVEYVRGLPSEEG